MKKKHIFLCKALFLAAAFVSCNNEEARLVQDNGINYSVTAGFGADTRTAVKNDNKTQVWVEGDKIFLYGADGSNAIMGLTSGADTQVGTFSGIVNGYYSNLTSAIYPAPANADEWNTYEFKSEMVWTNNSAAPLIGDLQDGLVQFRCLAPLVRIQLFGLSTTEKNTLVFTMAGGNGITGTATLNTEEETLTLTNGGDNVTVTIPTGKNSCNVDIPIPAGTYTGYTVTLNGTELKKVENAELVAEKEATICIVAGLNEALKAGSEVTLPADVTLNEPLVVEDDAIIDLSGYTLTTSKAAAGTDDITVAEGVSLTVKNGNIATANTAFYVNGGSLTLEDCTITAENNYTTVYADNGGIATAENVTVKTEGTAFYSNGGETMSLTNCVVTSTNGAVNTVAVENGAELTINGGSYTSVESKDTYDLSYTVKVSASTATINTTVSGGNGGVTVLKNSTVSFTGGSYSGVKACGLYVNGNSKVTYDKDDCTFIGVEGNVVVGADGTVNEKEYSEYTKVN